MTAWEVIGAIAWLMAGVLEASSYLGRTKNTRIRGKWRRVSHHVTRWIWVAILVTLGPAIGAGALAVRLVIGLCKQVYKRGVKVTAKRQRESQQ